MFLLRLELKMNVAKRVKKYNENALTAAVESVKNGSLSFKKASEIYNIPRSTLISRVKGWKTRGPSQRTSPGRVTDLPFETEVELAQHLDTLNRWGFGLSRKILCLVGTYVKANGLKTRFKDGIPKKDWFIHFCKRHGLSCKKPIKRQIVRTEQTTPQVIYGFFDLYESTVKSLDLQDKPHQIFNLDETSLCNDPSNTKVVSKKNQAVFRHTHGSGRSNTSILFCVAASGAKMPPFILYKAKNLWDVWMPTEAYPNTGYAATPHGWMTETAFFSWFRNHFIKYGPKERPLLLLFDGHSSHVSIELIKLAKQENICLLKLPPHTTHLLQPLDAVPFGTFKKKWDEEVVLWQREHYGVGMGKADFSVLVGKVWLSILENIIKKSFKVTGLYDDTLPNGNPINRHAIKTDNFKSSDMELYCAPKNQDTAIDHTINGDILEAVSNQPSTSHNHPILPSQKLEVIASATTSTADTNSTSAAAASTSDTAPTSASASTFAIACSSASGSGSAPISFEELLLGKVSRTTNSAIKKKVLCTNHANVITRDEYLQQLEETQKRNVLLKKTPKPKRKVTPDLDSDSDDVESDNQEWNSDSDLETYEGINSLEELVEAERAEQMEKSIEKESWILVAYATKKTLKHFVGQVKEMYPDDNLKVQFVRKKGDLFIWPTVPDVDTINMSDVVQVLPAPQNGRRGQIRFPIKFDAFHI